ncbi:hypothetical protein [Bordetella bronchiseptica]|uniref:Uncharacterized protein n=1 Tax=Bordetella bronchiseptica (strain ATCC BAA-588 / NCTC 13252 / RB50) TaxID=257310 RepID=A0A0H3LMT8_BORBR|nr:hypothetical protein [Bordetella bronchiseptica]KCV36297.1 hypothetical protein L489_3893 [Bordetella bronchiseptica 00-P-2730]SHT43179.1 Uncharacterised protein [Mycobacteroides abscessus subsp. abscessus]AMG88518.1 hypothetical protein AL472_12655 [Bordetella bronchiseptica]AMG89602.1 hypothetical protein AL472_19040 [Bordetella bronchiseptica]AWP80935.1 hypothetical protein B7P04_17110 [Bordetella bronchiseptica]
MGNFLRLVLPTPTDAPGLQDCRGIRLYTADGAPIPGLVAVKLEAGTDEPIWRATLIMDVNVSGKPD